MLELTKSDLATLLDVNIRTIERWQDVDDFPPPVFADGQNLYDAAAVVVWWRDRELAKVSRPVDENRLDAEQERAKLNRAQTESQELKNAELRGELAPRQMIEWVVSDALAQMVGILEALPQKVKRRVPRLSAPEIEIVKREIAKVRNICAKVTVNMDEYRRQQGEQ